MPDDFQSIPMVQPVLSRQSQYIPEIQRAPQPELPQMQRQQYYVPSIEVAQQLTVPQLQMQPGHDYPPLERKADPPMQPLSRQQPQAWPSVNQIMQMKPDQKQAYIDYAHGIVNQPKADIEEFIKRVSPGNAYSPPRVRQPYSQYTQDVEAAFRAATGRAAAPQEPSGGYHFK